MSNYIPDNILANVLQRLPFDSLNRFRCVSKQWRDLIDSSYFGEMHCRRNRSAIQTYLDHESKMIAWIGSKYFYTFDSTMKIPWLKFSFKHAIPWLLQHKNSKKGRYKAIAEKNLRSPPMELDFRGSLSLAGSCNGIVCLSSDWIDGFILWNPFTSTYSRPVTSPPPYEFGINAIGTAFGYDHINDDYKVVRWYRDRPCLGGRGRNLYEIFVYSLKNKSWRTIRDDFTVGLEPKTGYFPDKGAFANGAIHWAVIRGNFILAFDLGSYEFRRIPAPRHPQGSTCIAVRKELSGLNSSLCLGYRSYFRGREKALVDIWVMEEYGVVSSWTKLACIEDHDYPDEVFWRLQVVAYSKKRRELLLQGIVRLSIYDLDTKSLSKVTVHRKECDGSCVCVGSFVNPLLLEQNITCN